MLITFHTPREKEREGEAESNSGFLSRVADLISRERDGSHSRCRHQVEVFIRSLGYARRKAEAYRRQLAAARSAGAKPVNPRPRA